MDNSGQEELNELQTLLLQSLEYQQQADISASLGFLPLCLMLAWWLLDTTGLWLPFSLASGLAVRFLVSHLKGRRGFQQLKEKPAPDSVQHNSAWNLDIPVVISGPNGSHSSGARPSALPPQRAGKDGASAGCTSAG